MKKLIIYIFGISLIVGMTSCSKSWLELQPTTQASTETALTSVNDLKYALNGAYRSMGAHFYLGDYTTYYPEIRGEDMQCLTTASRGFSFYSFNESAGDQDITSMWLYGYQVLHYVNNIIDAIDNSGKFSASDATVKEIRSECLALRGFNLFVMTNVYCQAYSVAPNSPGIIIMLSKTAPEFMPKRSTVSECYAQAVKDMTDALGGLTKAKNNGYINYYAAEGLLSRIHLYMGNYDTALTYAKDVITNSSCTLWTNAQYASVWGKDWSSESLFEIYYSDTENVGSEAVGGAYNWDLYNSIILTQKYLDLLDQDPNDVRHCFHVTGPTSKNTTGKPYYLTKYCGKTGTVKAPVTPQNTNLCIVRLSEVYLTAAECAFRTNATSNALGYLNAIVTRSNPNKSVQSADLTLQRILDEKRREMVGEGVSGVYDLIRTRGASGVVDHSGGYHLALSNTKIGCSDKLMASPIPSAEIINNPNMVQNNGY